MTYKLYEVIALRTEMPKLCSEVDYCRWGEGEGGPRSSYYLHRTQRKIRLRLTTKEKAKSTWT